MLSEISFSSQLLYLIVLILIVVLFLLIKIVDYMKNATFNNTKIIEKHIINNKEEVHKKDKCNNLEDNIVIETENLDKKWSQSKKVESNMEGLGDKNITDGSASLDAVRLMRELNKNKRD